MTTHESPHTTIRQTKISRHPAHDYPNLNVGDDERLIGGALGVVLILPLIRRPSLSTCALATLGGALLVRSATGYCPAYHALGIDTAHPRSASAEDYFQRGVHIDRTFVIAKSPQYLYTFWRDFTNLPRFMRHLESVTVLSPTRSHWIATGPMHHVEWDAEIINDEPDHLLAWRSLDNADVHNAGSVTFTPLSADLGTEVRIVIDYIPPAGKLGSYIAMLFGEEPSIQIQEDLLRFKHLMETGTIPPPQTHSPAPDHTSQH